MDEVVSWVDWFFAGGVLDHLEREFASSGDEEEDSERAGQWQPPAKYIAPPRKQNSTWGVLGTDHMHQIMGFLDAKDLASVRAVDRWSFQVSNDAGPRNALWAKLHEAAHPRRSHAPRSQPRQQQSQVEQHAEAREPDRGEERKQPESEDNNDIDDDDDDSPNAFCAYLAAELRHCITETRDYAHCFYVHERIRAFRENKSIPADLREAGIIGMISELGFFEDERVARVVSRRRSQAMNTVVVTRSAVIQQYKQMHRNNGMHPGVVGPSFLPVSVVEHAQVDTRTLANKHEGVPGFVGFAINLLKLPPQYEYLRNSVFWVVLKDLMIFETAEDMTQYTIHLIETTGNPEAEVYGVALDQYSEDELDSVCPRFPSHRAREMPARQAEPIEHLRRLQRRVGNLRSSHAVVRLSYD